MTERPGRWPWRSFVGWLLGGLLLSAGILLGFGLLLPLSLLGLALIVITAVRGRRWPEALVALVGPGLILLAFARAAAFPGEPICPQDRHFVLRPDQQSYQCTEETSPWPWLVSGAVLLGAGTIGYALAYRVRNRRLSISPRPGASGAAGAP